jgi:hypothetical protein
VLFLDRDFDVTLFLRSITEATELVLVIGNNFDIVSNPPVIPARFVRVSIFTPFHRFAYTSTRSSHPIHPVDNKVKLATLNLEKLLPPNVEQFQTDFVVSQLPAQELPKLRLVCCGVKNAMMEKFCASRNVDFHDFVTFDLCDL